MLVLDTDTLTHLFHGHPQVVERGQVSVERQEVDRELWVDVQFRGIPELEPVILPVRGLTEQPVGARVLDSADAGVDARDAAPHAAPPGRRI